MLNRKKHTGTTGTHKPDPISGVWVRIGKFNSDLIAIFADAGRNTILELSRSRCNWCASGGGPTNWSLSRRHNWLRCRSRNNDGRLTWWRDRCVTGRNNWLRCRSRNNDGRLTWWRDRCVTGRNNWLRRHSRNYWRLSRGICLARTDLSATTTTSFSLLDLW